MKIFKFFGTFIGAVVLFIVGVLVADTVKPFLQKIPVVGSLIK